MPTSNTASHRALHHPRRLPHTAMSPIGQLIKPTTRAVQAITRVRTHVAIDAAFVVVRTPAELEPRTWALLGEFFKVVELARVQACTALARKDYRL